MTDTSLLAIDPVGCGCTECLIGEYKPVDQATADDMLALFLGELRDNAGLSWSIERSGLYAEGPFTVTPSWGPSFELDQIELPILVERYTVTLNQDDFDTATRLYYLGG